MTTNARRRLRANIAYHVDPARYLPGDLAYWDDDAVKDIAAIEAEASRATLDAIEAAVRDPERFGWTGLPLYAIAYAAAIRDVLAFIQKQREGGA